jgi:hypothetical protein
MGLKDYIKTRMDNPYTNSGNKILYRCSNYVFYEEASNEKGTGYFL